MLLDFYLNETFSSHKLCIALKSMKDMVYSLSLDWCG